MRPSLDSLALRYVRWLRRHVVAIVVAHAVLLGSAIYLVAFHLPLRADFSYLLPQEAPAVRDLRKLEARVRAVDTLLVIVKAETPAARTAAVTELATAIRALPPRLVERVTTDHADVRAFVEANRYLLAPLEDLEHARDALTEHIDRAQLAANPLFVPLDDDDDDSAGDLGIDTLRARHQALDDQLARLSNVSADGTIGVLEVRTPFRSTDAGRGEDLLAGLEQIRARVMQQHADVEIGITGGVVTSVAEHRAIASGMLLSALVTGALVLLVLALYFRSARSLALLVATLATGTAVAFGVSVLTVGHLNMSTAFLGALIAGNGVNYGILLLARFVEERRCREVEPALAHAIACTLRPTAIASLGAAIAYGALAASSFRGFADFALIGATGMLLVWVASYLLLPALLLRFGRHPAPDRSPRVGVVLAKLFASRRPRAVVVGGGVVCLIAAAISFHFIATDPFEYDMKQLRSQGGDAVTARRWMALSNRAFGSGRVGRVVIAADRLDQVPMIVDALHAIDAGMPEDQHVIGEIWSIHRFVPTDQPRKLAVIAELRELFDRAARVLDEDELRELADLRPRDDLAPLTLADIPDSVRERFIEKDGRVGHLIEIRPSHHINEWNGRDLIRFASAIRELRLETGERVTTSGTSVIFADILASIARDGPIVTLVAALGLVVMIGLLVGLDRRALAVLAATGAGSLLMVAACAVLGIKVTFLDFVALPITLGLGVDYSINIAQRHAEVADPVRTLQTSGGAVFVCSVTTIIGYGSLLVSDNRAIQTFGLAALIGEVACVLTALVLVPALIDARFRKRARLRETRGIF